MKLVVTELVKWTACWLTMLLIAHTVGTVAWSDRIINEVESIWKEAFMA